MEDGLKCQKIHPSLNIINTKKKQSLVLKETQWHSSSNVYVETYIRCHCVYTFIKRFQLYVY